MSSERKPAQQVPDSTLKGSESQTSLQIMNCHSQFHLCQRPNGTQIELKQPSLL